MPPLYLLDQINGPLGHCRVIAKNWESDIKEDLPLIWWPLYMHCSLIHIKQSLQQWGLVNNWECSAVIEDSSVLLGPNYIWRTPSTRTEDENFVGGKRLPQRSCHGLIMVEWRAHQSLLETGTGLREKENYLNMNYYQNRLKIGGCGQRMPLLVMGETERY